LKIEEEQRNAQKEIGAQISDNEKRKNKCLTELGAPLYEKVR
jgi:hypothetical protein